MKLSEPSQAVDPALRDFIDEVIVPALIERLSENQSNVSELVEPKQERLPLTATTSRSKTD